MPLPTSPVRDPLEILDNMSQIIRNEMLLPGHYVDPFGPDPDKADQMCGGHQACAVGALWLASGIHPTFDSSNRAWVLFSAVGGRSTEFKKNPGLGVAYEALNAASEVFIRAHHIEDSDLDRGMEGAMEQLFEGEYELDRVKDLLAIVDTARESLTTTTA